MDFSKEELNALSTQLTTLTNQVSKILAAANIEWPEDSQEGNSDRKFSRLASENAAVTNQVWENVARVDAKILPMNETMKVLNKQALNEYDEIYARTRQIQSDLFRDLKMMNTSHLEHLTNAQSNVVAGVVTGNQVASTREVAQDSELNDNLTQQLLATVATLAEVVDAIREEE